MDGKKILEKGVNQFLNDFIDAGANTASFMLYEKGSLKCYLSTCDKFHEFYTQAPEAKKCHIAHLAVDLARENQSFSIVWDLVKPNNDESKYLNEQRKFYNHYHGVSLGESLPNDIALGFVITGKKADINFSELVIKNKHQITNKLNRLKMIGSILIPDNN